MWELCGNYGGIYVVMSFSAVLRVYFFQNKNIM
nr:MAG TPA: hypothetical protein [Caudoviricetes sp.]DAS86046.1 MAG TPA: hypothetical protein [Caudoviricetes sp.]